MADYPEHVRKQLQDAMKGVRTEEIKVEKGKDFRNVNNDLRRPPDRTERDG